ncbi:hypothetical protein PTTG_31064 [Puccinia triticina 1-1 BBBD Race 1]|uniref:Uncharacterized protein n=1 Tax=Puccinia triticina (isolate 1-1 / race 1 (BBBD)) TaxID=630390 RepID=A0A180FYX4_PUCT1|nr:hypothetical protein PTTG_31064 [Puccinia triticina 1-1 BBBD Race 1]
MLHLQHAPLCPTMTTLYWILDKAKGPTRLLAPALAAAASATASSKTRRSSSPPSSAAPPPPSPNASSTTARPDAGRGQRDCASPCESQGSRTQQGYLALLDHH